jgi:hypothetical protein
VKAPTARQLLEHGIAAENWTLVAMLTLAASLEYIELLQAQQPLSAQDRFAALTQLARGNPVPLPATN